VNPPKLEFLTEDKAIFYRLCEGLGLPVPELYATFGQPAGWARGKGPVAGREEWERVLGDARVLPGTFVVKPAHGVYGRGVRVLERTQDGFLEVGGSRLSTSDLYRAMASDPVDRKFVIQERLRSHPDLEELSGVPFLQTVRVITHVGPDGCARVLLANFKVIVGESCVDNYHQGRSGNLYTHVEPASGRLDDAVGRDSGGLGVTVYPRHPKTGRSFAGFLLPHWEATRALVSRAAIALLPLRSIGWDVALTPEGPVLVEGNVWWDAPNELLLNPRNSATRREMAELLGRLEADAQRGVGPRD
jgi:hypothetical protein